MLPATDGTTCSLQEFADKKLLLVMFICNHCPFVKHIKQALVTLAHDFMPRGVGIVAINSNDIVAYPSDSMDNMKLEVASSGYPFPYLLDESQHVAKAYDAACTPDFFLFDSARKLVYRGQLDDSRPNNGIAVTGADLRAALQAALVGAPPSVQQTPSMGCNIKWRAGNAPV
jgi:peroxiredoxin